MDLEEKYREETGFSVGKIHDIGTTYYSNDYVEWLEKQLLLPRVIASTEFITELTEAIKGGVGEDWWFDGEDEVPYDTFDEDMATELAVEVLKKYLL